MEEKIIAVTAEEQQKPMPALTHVEANQEGYRWVAITAMLFAIGIILHTVSPNVGGVTPNWTIAMYAIVINLTRPPLTRAIGIGFIAGLTLVPSSKSAFPLGNSICSVSYGQLASGSFHYWFCRHLCFRQRIHFYFKTGFGPSVTCLDLRHAACSCGSRRP